MFAETNSTALQEEIQVTNILKNAAKAKDRKKAFAEQRVLAKTQMILPSGGLLGRDNEENKQSSGAKKRSIDI